MTELVNAEIAVVLWRQEFRGAIAQCGGPLLVVDQKSETPEIFEPDVFGLKISSESALWFITMKENLKTNLKQFNK